MNKPDNKQTWQEFITQQEEKRMELIRDGAFATCKHAIPQEPKEKFSDIIRALHSSQLIDGITCPYCGAEGKFTLPCCHDKPPFKYHAVCSQCGISTPFREDNDENVAIEKAMKLLRKYSTTKSISEIARNLFENHLTLLMAQLDDDRCGE